VTEITERMLRASGSLRWEDGKFLIQPWKRDSDLLILGYDVERGLVGSGKMQNQIMQPSVKKQPQYSILTGLTFLLTVLAALTVLPFRASKPDLLGLHTLCAFVPLSTIILLGLALFSRIMRDNLYKQEPR